MLVFTEAGGNDQAACFISEIVIKKPDTIHNRIMSGFLFILRKYRLSIHPNTKKMLKPELELQKRMRNFAEAAPDCNKIH